MSRKFTRRGRLFSISLISSAPISPVSADHYKNCNPLFFFISILLSILVVVVVVGILQQLREGQANGPLDTYVGKGLRISAHVRPCRDHYLVENIPKRPH